MACNITLPFWPTALDCLSWSQDNCLAVAVAERIALLIPRLRGPGANNTHWDICFITVNAFTAQEVPLIEPLSCANFSVGEELSQRQVHALEWSPPGLAKYGHCALAVLSSDHVLSIWAHDGAPNVATSWKPACIINNALRQHYSVSNAEDAEDAQNGAGLPKRSEQNVFKHRIRAFAWSPLPYQEVAGEDPELSPYLGRSHQFLAVSNEAGNILLLHVRSHYNVLSPDITTWHIDVTHTFDTGDFSPDALHPEISRSTIADWLAWAPWERSANVTIARLAFISNGRLWRSMVLLDSHSSPPKLSICQETPTRRLLPANSEMTGPLRVCSKTGHLIAFAPDQVWCINASDSVIDSEGVSMHHLDGRWDEISGVAFTSQSAAHLQADFVSHLSASSATTTTLALPSLNTAKPPQVAWQTALVEAKAAFSAEHGLDHHVQERTWGIAASPLGDYVATCVSMHAADVITYAIGSEQFCQVEITRTGDLSIQLSFTANSETGKPEYRSSEAVLFSVQRYLDSIARYRDGERPDQGQLAHVISLSLRHSYSQYKPEHWESPHDASTPEQVSRYLRARVYFQPERIEARCARLADIALRGASDIGVNPAVRSTMLNLVSVVIGLSPSCYDTGDLSATVLKIFTRIKATLEERPVLTDTGGAAEQCSLCKSPVPLESVKWARCTSGHQFARCGLTLSAIREPGISKSCAICGVQYLNETALPDFSEPLCEASNGVIAMHEPTELTDEEGSLTHSQKKKTMAESNRSLARLLFAACDRCLYCGGKFVA